MSKVYVLTNGCYSDTTIVGIFTSKEVAERAQEVFNDDPVVEEIELDACADRIQRGEALWRVDITIDTGEITRVEQPYREFKTSQWKTREKLSVVCWARDEATAVKIATDRRRVVVATEPTP